MKIVVFGASGKLGRHLVREALARGHDVTSFVLPGEKARQTEFMPGHAVKEGDVYDPDSVTHAIQGQDAVISALGRRGASKRKPVCRDGIKAILPAMEQSGVERLIAISAYGAGETRDAGLYTKLLRLTDKDAMADKDQMEALVKASQTDWTILRPARYRDRGTKHGYQLAGRLKGRFPTVTRAGVAKAALDLLERDDYFHVQTAVRGA